MLKDRVCIVTGGSRGMGRAAAVEMSRQGAAAVAVLDVKRDGGEETVSLVKEQGAEGLYVECDLASSADIVRAVGAVISRFGGLDVLHNNAGVFDMQFTDNPDFDALDEETWDRVFRVVLKATWLVSKYSAPHLRQSKRSPAIVSAASIAAVTTFPHTAYNAAKAGVIALTRSMAVTLAPDVRVNCYSPGSISTPMNAEAAAKLPAKWTPTPQTALIPRRGYPEEVAKLVCFLASEDASYITGSHYIIDGGILAWRGYREEAEPVAAE